ncbi:hypothetical protein [Paraburkholderia sp. HD33-4]|uniref:hypothetical protein n=1 Tax=Paraburkholderia sp. HD33-4 TaxID=2883242 RepID=UPI001F44FB4C|nr:hypothetical protein [Paraburkholderia sp. HD33-4]
MATNITITETPRVRTSAPAAAGTAAAAATPSRKLPGWLWFIALWCFGVAAAVSLGFAFKLLMNATLFAVG